MPACCRRCPTDARRTGWLRPLARVAGQPADGPGDGQPPVGRVLRPRASSARPRTSASRASRRRTPNCSTGWPSSSSSTGWSMKQLHRLIVTQRHLPAVVAGRRRSCWRRTRERAAGPRPARPAGGRADPRRGAAVERAAVAEDRRAERVPAAAGGGDDRGRPTARSTGRSSQGEDRYRRGLYTFTKRTAPFAMFSDVRRPQRRGVRRPARGDEHAAAGADAAQRPGLRRGGAGARAATGRGRTGTTEERGDATCSAAAWPGRRAGRAGDCWSQFYDAPAASGSTQRASSTPRRVAGPGDGPTLVERAAWTAAGPRRC